MEKIDLLKFHKSKHKKKKMAAVITAIVFLMFGVIFMSYKIFYQPRELDTKMGFFASLSHLITASDRRLFEEQKNINILFLGMGGVGHEGPYLTDTILLASLNKDDDKMAMLSIPRDFLVATKKFGKQKINAINSYAEIENQGSGAEFTRNILEELLDVRIDYYLRMDFNSFEQIIDAAGGVTIDVPRTFSDPLYPRVSDPSKTTVITFEAGPQHMDGRTTLIYARSRHGNNGEGNDFARSRRQQQIILALKDKIISNETLTSAGKIKDILSAIKNNISTDINPWEAIQLASLYKKLNISTEKISVNVLTNGPDGPFYSTYYNNQYVLLPKKPDYSDLRQIAQNPFNDARKQYTGSYGTPSGISILVLNGTGQNGLANETAMTLSDFGYRIKETANAPIKDYEKNVIYEIAPEINAGALKDIKEILDANVSQTLPEWLKPMVDAADKPDFVIVVGAPLS